MLLFVVVGAGSTACVGAPGPDDHLGIAVQDVTPPPPTGLVATVVSPQVVSLSWDPIAVSGATYVVLRGLTSGSETTLSSTAPDGNTNYVDDSHLTPGTQYCYEVLSVVAGTASGPSAEECVLTSPGPVAPTGLTAAAISSTSIQLAWNPVPGAVRYYMLRQVNGGPFNFIGSVAAPTVSFLVEALAPSTRYTFAIETFADGLFSPPSATATAITFSAGLEAEYHFDEKTGTTALDSAPARRNGTLSGGAVLTIADQAPLKDASDHNPSSLSLPTATAVMSAPGSAVFGASGDTSISLWVKLPAAPAGALAIAGRRVAGCGPLMWQIGQDATNGLNFAAGSVTRFGTTLAVGAWTQLGVTQHGNLLQLFVNGAPVASSSFVAGNTSSAPLQVGDVGGCGNGGALLVDQIKVFSRLLSAAEMAALGTRPPPPGGLTVTETHSTFLKFSWPAVPGADHYIVFKGSAPGAEAFFTSANDTTFRADHMSPAETTFWKVLTISKGEFLMSDLSAELVATTSPPPAPPTGLTATLDPCCTPNRINLKWDPAPGAVQYILLQSTAGGPFTQISSPLAGTTGFQVANLTSGTSYAFEIETRDDGGAIGPPSAPASSTVP